MTAGGKTALLFEGGGRRRVLEVRRHAASRRMRLSVDPRDGAVRLTLPPRAPVAAALRWAEAQRGWIEEALAALAPSQPILPGATIPWRGGTLTIEWAADRPRTAREAGGVLHVGGPRETLAPRVLRWARAQAASVLEAETRALADRSGIAVGRVGVGDPRSRWGSCSASGDIRYSWRLILAPHAVLEATVAHEVAHRLHMDHGAAFHAAVARLLGRDPAPERRWLRAHGAALYGLGGES